MTDSNGFKYEFGGQRYRTNDEVNAALATYLQLDSLPLMGKHNGEIVLLPSDQFVRTFTYVHEDGVDKITPV